jgi:hypothetical protein
MSDPTMCIEAETGGATLVIPVSKQYPRAQVVGVARLRYRPTTRRTLVWTMESAANLPTHVERYAKLRQDAERRRARVAARG